jgi:hypothetical protein
MLSRQVSTRPEKIRAFFPQLVEMDAEFMVILEVCGLNDWLITDLRAWNCREIVLIHPEKPSRKKTDRRDARKLADLLWLNRERLGYVPPAAQRSLTNRTSIAGWYRLLRHSNGTSAVAVRECSVSEYHDVAPGPVPTCRCRAHDRWQKRRLAKRSGLVARALTGKELHRIKGLHSLEHVIHRSSNLASQHRHGSALAMLVLLARKELLSVLAVAGQSSRFFKIPEETPSDMLCHGLVVESLDDFSRFAGQDFGMLSGDPILDRVGAILLVANRPPGA